MLPQKITNRSAVNALSLFLTLFSGLAHAEPVHYVSLNTGLDSDNGTLVDAYIDIGVSEKLRISLGLGQDTVQGTEGSITTKQRQISISGYHHQSGFSALTWSLSYRTWGKKDAIETQDSNISIGYFFSNHWHLMLDYEIGKLEMFIKPKFAKRIASIASDRHAWRLTTGYTHHSGAFWLSFLQRQYEKNLPVISQRPRFQRAITSIALDHAYSLSKEEFSMGYEWLFETLDLGVDYSRYASTANNHYHYASIYTRFYIGLNLTVNLAVEQEINAPFTVYTAGIGFAW